MLNLKTAGESHGKGIIALIENLPAGLAVNADEISNELSLRRKGYGRGNRMEIEKDEVEILSGLFKGKTIGSPLCILIKNTEHETWAPYFEGNEVRPELDRTVARPGHADYAGSLKYGFSNLRPVIERASARHTAAYVAAGAVFKKALSLFDVCIGSFLSSVGNKMLRIPETVTFDMILRARESDFHVLVKDDEKTVKDEVDKAINAGTSLGGSCFFVAFGVVPGIGGYSTFDKRLDYRIGGLMHSIPSVKAVEIGLGVELSRRYGYEAMDEFSVDSSKIVTRKTNYAGGIEGGVSNGEPIFGRVYFKPIPTQKKSLNGVDIERVTVKPAFYERSDVFAGKAISIISESLLSYAILKSYLEKFGGDNFSETLLAYRSYVERLRWKPKKELQL